MSNLTRARIERYIEKMEIIEDNITDIERWIIEINELPIDQISKKEKYAIYHAYQIIIEAITDVNAMLVKDAGKLPKDDYRNMELLDLLEILSKQIVDQLKHANGLRNRIVHEYNGLNDSMAFEAIKEHLDIFPEYLERVKRWTIQQ